MAKRKLGKANHNGTQSKSPVLKGSNVITKYTVPTPPNRIFRLKQRTRMQNDAEMSHNNEKELINTTRETEEEFMPRHKESCGSLTSVTLGRQGSRTGRDSQSNKPQPIKDRKTTVDLKVIEQSQGFQGLKGIAPYVGSTVVWLTPPIQITDSQPKGNPETPLSPKPVPSAPITKPAIDSTQGKEKTTRSKESVGAHGYEKEFRPFKGTSANLINVTPPLKVKYSSKVQSTPSSPKFQPSSYPDVSHSLFKYFNENKSERPAVKSEIGKKVSRSEGAIRTKQTASNTLPKTNPPPKTVSSDPQKIMEDYTKMMNEQKNVTTHKLHGLNEVLKRTSHCALVKDRVGIPFQQVGEVVMRQKMETKFLHFSEEENERGKNSFPYKLRDKNDNLLDVSGGVTNIEGTDHEFDAKTLGNAPTHGKSLSSKSSVPSEGVVTSRSSRTKQIEEKLLQNWFNELGSQSLDPRLKQQKKAEMEFENENDSCGCVKSGEVHSKQKDLSRLSSSSPHEAQSSRGMVEKDENNRRSRNGSAKSGRSKSSNGSPPTRSVSVADRVIDEFINEGNMKSLKQNKVFTDVSNNTEQKGNIKKISEKLTQNVGVQSSLSKLPISGSKSPSSHHSNSVTQVFHLNPRQNYSSSSDVSDFSDAQELSREVMLGYSSKKRGNSENDPKSLKVPAKAQQQEEIMKDAKVQMGCADEGPSSLPADDDLNVLQTTIMKNLSKSYNKTSSEKKRQNTRKRSRDGDEKLTVKKAKTFLEIERNEKKMQSILDSVLNEAKKKSRERRLGEDSPLSRRTLFTSTSPNPVRHRSMLREGPDHPLTKMLKNYSTNYKSQRQADQKTKNYSNSDPKTSCPETNRTHNDQKIYELNVPSLKAKKSLFSDEVIVDENLRSKLSQANVVSKLVTHPDLVVGMTESKVKLITTAEVIEDPKNLQPSPSFLGPKKIPFSEMIVNPMLESIDVDLPGSREDENTNSRDDRKSSDSSSKGQQPQDGIPHQSTSSDSIDVIDLTLSDDENCDVVQEEDRQGCKRSGSIDERSKNGKLHHNGTIETFTNSKNENTNYTSREVSDGDQKSPTASLIAPVPEQAVRPEKIQTDSKEFRSQQSSNATAWSQSTKNSGDDVVSCTGEENCALDDTTNMRDNVEETKFDSSITISEEAIKDEMDVSSVHQKAQNNDVAADSSFKRRSSDMTDDGISSNKKSDFYASAHLQRFVDLESDIKNENFSEDKAKEKQPAPDSNPDFTGDGKIRSSKNPEENDGVIQSEKTMTLTQTSKGNNKNSMFDISQFFDDDDVMHDDDAGGLSHAELENLDYLPEFIRKDEISAFRKKIQDERETEDGENGDLLDELPDLTETPSAKRRRLSEQNSSRRPSLVESEMMMSKLLSRSLRTEEFSQDSSEGTEWIQEIDEVVNPDPRPLRNSRKRMRNADQTSTLRPQPSFAAVLADSAFSRSYKKHGASLKKLVREKNRENEVDKMERILLSDLKKGGFRKTLERAENGDGKNTDCDEDTKRAINLMKKDWGTLPHLSASSKIFERKKLDYCHHNMDLKSWISSKDLQAMDPRIRKVVLSTTAADIAQHTGILNFMLNESSTRVGTFKWLLNVLQVHPNSDTVRQIIESNIRERNFSEAPYCYFTFPTALTSSGIQKDVFTETPTTESAIVEEVPELTMCEECMRRRRKTLPRNIINTVKVCSSVLHIHPQIANRSQLVEFGVFLLLLLQDETFITWNGEIMEMIGIFLTDIKEWNSMKFEIARRFIQICTRLNVVQETVDRLHFGEERPHELSRIISFAVLKLSVFGENPQTVGMKNFADLGALVEIVDHFNPDNLEVLLSPDKSDEQIGSQKRSYYHLSLLLPLLNICIGDECNDNSTFVVLDRIWAILRTMNKRIRDNGAIYRSQVKYELSLFTKNLRNLIQKAPKQNKASIFKYLRSAPVKEEVVDNSMEEIDSSDSCDEVGVSYNEDDDEVKGQAPNFSSKSNVVLDDEFQLAEVIKSRIIGSAGKD